MSDVVPSVQRIVQTAAAAALERFRRPVATYRLQFDKEHLTFRDAENLATYLDALGVSHVYASPCHKARSGSPNSYAIVDHTALNPDFGGAADYRAMVAALHGRGLGQIEDFVPNHMSATPGENAWWTDVLENGPSSPYAEYFDIDWQPIKDELRNRILLPVLGGQYGEVLESGQLQLAYRGGAFFFRYFEAALPLDPRTYLPILTAHLAELREAPPTCVEHLRELESIITAAEHLPERTESAAERVVERQREKEVIKDRLRKLTEQSATVAQFIARNVQEYNGVPQDPQSFDRLDKLLDAQVYRLCYWKAAADEINYRRFFDVNELAAICVEEPKVFEACHRLTLELLADGSVDGLRIDHIDGLYDPTEYLRRLQRDYLLAVAAKLGLEPPAEPAVAPPDAASAAREAAPPVPDVGTPLYVLVEKILGPNEPLPPEWPVAGTTGYDFLNVVNGLFVDPHGLDELIKLYGRFIGRRLDFREVAYESKMLILRVAMASDLQLLARRLNRISEKHRRSRDFTLNALRAALREIIACFPVYRTYIREGHVSERDRQVVARATAAAKRRNPAVDAAVFDFIRDVLLLERPPGLDEAGRRERGLFVGRFQQVTSPVMAKGVEDTAFYRYLPLVSLNEVSGDPARGTTTCEEFHRQNAARLGQWPRSLLASTTHDTKRSEGVRARINVLSEMPRPWRNAVNRWARLNRRQHRNLDGVAAPSRNDEYLFYQTLVGAWPLETPDRAGHRQFVQRMQQYMLKATHEAKLTTSWISPNQEYDAAVAAFVAAALDDSPKNRFLAEFRAFHERIVDWGVYGALAQTLLKLTAPGVPDIYQGQELWDFSLVDPDNRRPVDFVCRRELLAELQAAAAGGDEALLALAQRLARTPRDSRLKLLTIWRTLQFRRRHAELFDAGQYRPLAIHGAKAAHACAFVRLAGVNTRQSGPLAIVVVPRLLAALTPTPAEGRAPPPLGQDIWQDTRLEIDLLACPPLKHLFTGQACVVENGTLPLARVLADFPVAVLSNVE